MKKIIAISGASGMIGLSLSEALVKKGHYLFLGDINIKNIKELRNKYPEKINYAKSNLTKSSQIQKFIVAGVSKFKKIDSFVLCAYPKSKKWGSSFEELRENNLKNDLYNQLGSTIIFCQQIVKYFLKNKIKGNIILISSIQGFSAPKFEHYNKTKMTSPIEYSAIKSGIISITRYLAKYLKKKNIRINCISPGGILNNQPKSFIKAYKKSCTSKGLLAPEDISRVISFMLEKESNYINGQNIIVDDGWSL
jgi:NAD(P)-dependent dehydrogenase (short-subunit alcohol dehydrogenase family)